VYSASCFYRGKGEYEAQTRCDKLEATAEMDKQKRRCDIQAKIKIDKGKYKAQARSDKLEAVLEKRNVQTRCDKLEAKVEMDKRDAQARCDKLEAALENEKKDRLVQQQIDQLKWEARPAGQISQLACGSAPPPASSYILQNTPAVDPPAVLLPAKSLPTHTASTQKYAKANCQHWECSTHRGDTEGGRGR
jgi:hypothetical protein